MFCDDDDDDYFTVTLARAKINSSIPANLLSRSRLLGKTSTSLPSGETKMKGSNFVFLQFLNQIICSDWQRILHHAALCLPSNY